MAGVHSRSWMILTLFCRKAVHSAGACPRSVTSFGWKPRSARLSCMPRALATTSTGLSNELVGENSSASGHSLLAHRQPSRVALKHVSRALAYVTRVPEYTSCADVW
eukprot:6184033-Pleurochrysis_carterae.AAC.4